MRIRLALYTCIRHGRIEALRRSVLSAHDQAVKALSLHTTSRYRCVDSGEALHVVGIWRCGRSATPLPGKDQHECGNATAARRISLGLQYGIIIIIRQLFAPGPNHRPTDSMRAIAGTALVALLALEHPAERNTQARP